MDIFSSFLGIVLRIIRSWSTYMFNLIKNDFFQSRYAFYNLTSNLWEFHCYPFLWTLDIIRHFLFHTLWWSLICFKIAFHWLLMHIFLSIFGPLDIFFVKYLLKSVVHFLLFSTGLSFSTISYWFVIFPLLIRSLSLLGLVGGTGS